MQITSPLIPAMFQTLSDSVEELKAKISNVRHGGIESNKEVILFELEKISYKGILTGRNRDLCVGFGAEQDKAIAARVFLDNCSEKL